MGLVGGNRLRRGRTVQHLTTGLAFVSLCSTFGSCTWMPSEFNLSPLYRHRLEKDGTVLEMDVLWPLIHYETLVSGGTDFRIRPFYRRVEKPDTPGFGKTPERPPGDPSALSDPSTNDPLAAEPATGSRPWQTDHQFLYPFGRVRSRDKETQSRLFPLWDHRSREFVDGRKETDWYFLFPFFWGGSDQESPDAPVEPYFGFFPFWADFPGEFLTYDRLSIHFWPLHVRTEKDGRVGQMFLWPLIGYGYSEDETQSYWYRFLPFFNFIARKDDYERYSVLWPFINWGTDLEYTDDPLKSFHLWPLFGWQTSEKRNAWSFLWPFFRGQNIEGKKRQLDILWPIFHWLEDYAGGDEIETWWVWPFVSRTKAKHQSSWSFLWPLIWWREYDDSDGKQDQQWIVPFFKRVHRVYKGGTDRWSRTGEDHYMQIWPLFHTESKHDDTGEFVFPSPWFFRDGNEEGVGEAYDWAYTLFRTRDRAKDDHAVELAANLFTSRTRGDRTQASVPFLFSYESEKGAGTFYLFNCIPIPFGSSGSGEGDSK